MYMYIQMAETLCLFGLVKPMSAQPYANSNPQPACRNLVLLPALLETLFFLSSAACLYQKPSIWGFKRKAAASRDS